MSKSLFDKINNAELQRQPETLTLNEYLELIKTDPSAYATAQERFLTAAGKPSIIDTSLDQRLASVFAGKKIEIYPAFKDVLFGMEEDVASVMSFIKNAAQGLEEANKILFILGDVATGKSTFVNRMKFLMESQPVYVLATEEGIITPGFENPLGLFIQHLDIFVEEFNIAPRYFPTCLSSWSQLRLKEYEGDRSRFKVVKMYPSISRQEMITKTEPLDDNNADQSTLIGKVNMRQLQYFAQNHPDAYNYSGALCRGNRGLVEMAEMYKANIKTLSPLLEATQSHNFNGLEQIGSLPFNGLLVSHSNKSEYARIASDKNNEAILDRTTVVKFHVPLRYTENELIFKRMVNESLLSTNPIVPDVYNILAKFKVLTSLEEIDRSNLYSKMCVYNGDNVKNEDNRALPYADYKLVASQDEGLSGMSNRVLFGILAKTFNYHTEEISADPVTLFAVLKDEIIKMQLASDLEKKYLGFITEWLEPKYVQNLKKQFQSAYIESYGDYAQAKFDTYFELANAWRKGIDYNDPVTGVRMDTDKLHSRLVEFERAGSIGDYKDFRNEAVMFILEERSKNKNVKWSSYRKLADVIEKSVFKTMEDMLPIISFGAKTSKKEQQAHDRFVENMIKLGYTHNQVRNLVGYYFGKQHS